MPATEIIPKKNIPSLTKKNIKGYESIHIEKIHSSVNKNIKNQWKIKPPIG